MDRKDFFERLHQTSDFSRRYVSKSYALLQRIRWQMDTLGWDQRKLATVLGKTEPEVSKWLSGFHNFTLKSIMKLEEALEFDLIQIPEDQTFFLALIRGHHEESFATLEKFFPASEIKTDSRNLEFITIDSKFTTKLS